MQFLFTCSISPEIKRKHYAINRFQSCHGGRLTLKCDHVSSGFELKKTMKCKTLAMTYICLYTAYRHIR